jgi:tetratricopeptide (TPR) repeat protein
MANRPAARPETRPGKVEYPRPNRPNTPNAQAQRPYRQPEVRPGKNSRPVRRPMMGNNNQINSGNVTNNNWWQSNKMTNNQFNTYNTYNQVNQYNNRPRPNHGYVNHNFSNNVNWSTNRRHWGYNPWWNRPATRPWYGGSWNCGWNNTYYRKHYYHYHYHGYGYRPLPGYVVYKDNSDDWARAVGWGLVGWSLGKLVYDTGYQTYRNPYPVQPVPTSSGQAVTYNQPITVVAAQTAPKESDSSKITEASESHIATSQEAFRRRDYLKALESANKAVAEAPGDGALHEYRALVLFALGKFSEAAGVLNPVLAGGPGWDWSTMVRLYDSQDTYMKQLDALQKYSDAKPEAADAKFLLGYHYMVCGHLTEANQEFTEAARLQPADSVSAQLRDLTKASSNGEEPEETPATEENTPAAEEPPAPLDLAKLTGSWSANRGDQGTISLVFKDDGKFVWTYSRDTTSSEFSGDFSMNDDGLLVLDAEESQMVATVELAKEGELKFVLAGGPPDDPGLLFVRK